MERCHEKLALNDPACWPLPAWMKRSESQPTFQRNPQVGRVETTTQMSE
jgi:hypothetical protein